MVNVDLSHKVCFDFIFLFESTNEYLSRYSIKQQFINV